jgi:3-oxoacyl-[acyl-carrier-protein] synthase II
VSRRRVVITGLGAVSAAGVGVKELWRALRDGVSGIGPITRFDATAYQCQVAAEVREFEPRDFMSGRVAATTNRFTQFGVAVARMAYQAAGLDGVRAAHSFPVCFGSSTTGIREFQDAVTDFARTGGPLISPTVILETIGSAVTSRVASELGFTGPTMTLAAGCASAIDAVNWGWEQIRSGQAPCLLAGATDTPLSTTIHAAWSSLGQLSTWPGPPAQALRPFDAGSTGTVLGEGAGAYVLEDLEHARARGATIHAEVLGYGIGTEGLQPRVADATVASLETALRNALRSSRLDPSDIDYVSTHAGGILKQDRAETAAIRNVFGRHAYNVPVTSIKPVTGNPFSAAGALQIIAACFTLGEQFIPPTLNLDVPDQECDLDYVPNRGRTARVNRLLIATRAIGPTYSAIVLSRPPDC